MCYYFSMDERNYPITHSNFCEPEDFQKMWGIDLKSVMRDGGMSPDAFLAREERKIKHYIDKTSFRTYNWRVLESVPAWREAMQLAILTQAYYTYRNTDIATDSGYDPDKGVTADSNQLKKITICDEAYEYLHNAGILNRTLAKHLGRRWDF